MTDRIRLGRTRIVDPRIDLVTYTGVLVGLFAGIAWVTQVGRMNSLWNTLVPPVACAAAVLVAAWGFRKYLVSRETAWLTVTTDGFGYESSAGRARVADADVTDLATGTETLYANGRATLDRRTVTLALLRRGRVVPLSLVGDGPPGGPDPLQPLVNRLLNGLVARARDALAAGGSVTGDRWLLAAGELRFAAGGTVVSLSPDRVAGVEVVGDEVCVWAAGEREAVARVPAGSRNALVLCHLLWRPAEDAPPADTPPPAAWGEPAADGLDVGMGNLLHERDKTLSNAERVYLLLIALVAVPATLYGWREVYYGRADKADLFLACLGPVWTGGAVHWAFWRHVSVLRLYAHGLSFTNPRGTAALRYADVGTVTYSSTRVFVNGVYQGTNTKLVLTPADPARGQPVTVAGQFQNADATLESARDAACRAVAGRMLGELAAGRPVAWADRLVLTPDGLQLPRGEVVPFADLGWDVRDGTLRLTRGDDRRAVRKVEADGLNVLPGLMVVEELYARAAERVSAR